MKKLLLVALTALLISAPAAAEVTAGIVAPYLHIQLALANDSTDGVADAAKAVATAAGKLGDAGRSIAAAAQAVAGAADLKTVRATFGPLSDALIDYGQEVGFGDFKVAYCPMVGKSWVQKDGDILNPFYGSTMLNCGDFTQ